MNTTKLASIGIVLVHFRDSSNGFALIIQARKKPKLISELRLCGMDGTRTRDPLRDRQVF